MTKSPKFQEVNPSIVKDLQQFSKDIKSVSLGLNKLRNDVQQTFKIFNENIKPQILAFQNLIRQNQQIFENFADFWREFQKRYKIAETQAAKILKKYKWFITPSFPPSFVFKIVEIDRKKGRCDKEINKLFVDYFQINNWQRLGELSERWRNNPLLQKRRKILSDCVMVVKESNAKPCNSANVVLPTLISQIDGALSDYLKSKGNLGNKKYSEKKKLFLKEKNKTLPGTLDEIINDVFLNILFQDSMAGKPLKNPFSFNRHKIIHGENVNYGKKVYMIRAFMILDFLSYLK